MRDFSSITDSIIASDRLLPPDQLNKHKKEAMLKEIDDSGFSRGSYGSKRTLRVSVDVNQFLVDEVDGRTGAVYGWFNYLVKREPRVDQCRSVFEGLKEMCLGADEGAFLPAFLRGVWLGGDQSASGDVNGGSRHVILSDVFQDEAHLKASFDQDVTVLSNEQDKQDETATSIGDTTKEGGSAAAVGNGSYIVSFPSDKTDTQDDLPLALKDVVESNALDMSEESDSIIARTCPAVYTGPFSDPPTTRFSEYRFTKQQGTRTKLQLLIMRSVSNRWRHVSRCNSHQRLARNRENRSRSSDHCKSIAEPSRPAYLACRRYTTIHRHSLHTYPRTNTLASRPTLATYRTRRWRRILSKTTLPGHRQTRTSSLVHQCSCRLVG